MDGGEPDAQGHPRPFEDRADPREHVVPTAVAAVAASSTDQVEAADPVAGRTVGPRAVGAVVFGPQPLDAVLVGERVHGVALGVRTNTDSRLRGGAGHATHMDLKSKSPNDSPVLEAVSPPTDLPAASIVAANCGTMYPPWLWSISCIWCDNSRRALSSIVPIACEYRLLYCALSK